MSRRAVLADLDELLAIQKESAVAGFANVFPPERYPYPEAEVRESLRSLLDQPGTIALLEEDGRGFALVGAGWLHRLYVRPSAWGDGVGAALHDDGLEVLRRLGRSLALGARRQPPGARLLRAAWMASERRRAAGSVSAESDRGRLLDRAARREQAVAVTAYAALVSQ